VFQDRNGDGAVDFVNARVALADRPSAGDLAAAADVAARLGFETSAMDLPVRMQADSGSDQPTVFVGTRSLPGSGVTADFLGATSLKAGDGLVAAFSTSAGPSVAVLGGDESGISAAARRPAARASHDEPVAAGHVLQRRH